MLQIDFQDSNEARRGGRYERLASGDEKAARTRRFRWKKLNGRSVKGLKLSRSGRKLNWKPFSIMVILSRKIARKYVDLVRRMKMDEACPAIVFSCQWGLPVLSHSSQNSRKNSISHYRSLTWIQSRYVKHG